MMEVKVSVWEHAYDGLFREPEKKLVFDNLNPSIWRIINDRIYWFNTFYYFGEHGADSDSNQTPIKSRIPYFLNGLNLKVR